MNWLVGDFGIREPLAASLGLVLIVVAILALRGNRIKRRALTSLGISVPTQSHRPRVVTAIVILLSLALLRPHWGAENVSIRRSGTDVILLVDVSLSMLANDTPPSRMEVARRKLKDLISHLTQQRHVARIGITVFAGDAYTLCPLTSDFAVIRQFIDVVSPELVASVGSNLRAALALAISSFPTSEASSSRIILLSDGEDNLIGQSQIAREVRSRGIRIDVLGLGTPTGATITLPNGVVVRDRNGHPAVTTIQEGPLREVADVSGGTYHRATIDDSDMMAISRFDSAQYSTSSEVITIQNFREFGPVLAALALGLAVLFAWLRGASLLALCLTIFLAPTATLCEPLPLPSLSSRGTTPFHLYERGEYQLAVDAFSQELKTDPTNRALRQGLASSLFKLGRAQESQQIFHQLAAESSEGREYFENTYNEANSLLAMGQLQDAIAAYQRALDVKPEDPLATHNLQVARALREEQRNNSLTATPTPSQTPTHTPTSTPSSQQEPSPTPQHSSSASASERQGATPSPDSSSESEGSSMPTPSSQSSQANSTDSSQTTAASPTTASSSESSSYSSGDNPDHGAPSPSPASSPSTARLREAQETPAEPDAMNQQEIESPPPADSPVAEADAWLNSLPDSPLLVRKFKGDPMGGEQTW